MRSVSGLVTITLLASLAVPSSSSILAQGNEEKVLNVYGWSDYIDAATIAEFTKRTGIKVNFDVYDSNEVLEAKLLAGKSGYDVVFPSAMPYFAKQVKVGLYRKLDLNSIPNAKGVDPKILERLKAADPDNAFGLPYMSSATAIGYIKSKITPLLPSAPVGSLALIFDPKVLSSLRSCGVTVLDAADEVFPAALSYLGKDPTSTSELDLKAAADVVAKARPGYRYFHSSRYITDLANGEICVAQGWAGDLFQARRRAEEAKNGIQIEIFLPKEGASFNIDVMAIPRDAPHPRNAEIFINFILEPKIIAALTEAVGYANAVPASRGLLPPSITGDPVVYPPIDAKLHVPPAVSAQFDRLRSREWTRVKSGL